MLVMPSSYQVIAVAGGVSKDHVQGERRTQQHKKIECEQ